MLMDEPYRQPDGLARWSDLASATGPVVQRDIRAHRTAVFEDWVGDPGMAEFRLDGTGEWSTLVPGPVDVTGRLIGGCIETVTNLTGTPYGDSRGGRSGSRRARSSTSRRARTTRSRSAATCTASGWPAGSTAPARW